MNCRCVWDRDQNGVGYNIAERCLGHQIVDAISNQTKEQLNKHSDGAPTNNSEDNLTKRVEQVDMTLNRVESLLQQILTLLKGE